MSDTTPAPEAASTCANCGLPILVSAYGLPSASRKKKWKHANGLRSCVTAKGMRTVATPVEATS